MVLVGEDPASKRSICGPQEKGLRHSGLYYSEEYKLPADTKETDLLDLIKKLNAKTEIHGTGAAALAEWVESSKSH